MSNPFILIARIRVKEGKVEEYLKIAKEADDAVNASEPDMLIHTFDQDPTDPLEFTWSEVYRTSEAMVHRINNPPVVAYVEKHQEIADKFEIEVYGNITDETIKAIEALNVPFKHFKTTEVGYIRKEKFIYLKKDDQMFEDDNGYVVVSSDQLNPILKAFGHEEKIAKNVLIIGGLGQVGKELTKFLLKKGNKVYVITNKKSRKRRETEWFLIVSKRITLSI